MPQIFTNIAGDPGARPPRAPENGSIASASIDKQTLSFIYEISLDKLKLRRTVIPLFANSNNPPQAFEGECSRQ